MSRLKSVIKSIKSKYDIDFNRVSYFKLKEEALESYMKDENKSYVLDIMADVKEILTDRNEEAETKKFLVKTLLELVRV